LRCNAFANDSADLVATEDKEELDRLATVMMNPKLQFVAGEIDGYTDNVGDAAYNCRRRADAVAAYLKSKASCWAAIHDEVRRGRSGGRQRHRRGTRSEPSRHDRRTDCGPAS
jgi:hypothetical protein